MTLDCDASEASRAMVEPLPTETVSAARLSNPEMYFTLMPRLVASAA